MIRVVLIPCLYRRVFYLAFPFFLYNSESIHFGQTNCIL